MRKTAKKLTAVLLAVAILLTLAVNSFATNSAPTQSVVTSNPASNPPLSIDIATNRNFYGLLSAIKYTVTITNISSETVTNVSAEALFGDDLAPLANDSQFTAEAEGLAPGESMTFIYNATLRNLKSVDIFLYIFKLIANLFTGSVATLEENGFNDGREYAETSKTIKVASAFNAKYGVENTVRVWYGSSIERQDNFFYDFYADIHAIKVGESSEIVFKAIVTSPEIIDKISVYTKTGDFVCYLYDNGAGKDALANDGIFSGSAVLTSSTRKVVEYYAEHNGVKSDSYPINFYKPLTENDHSTINNFNNAIKDIKSQFVETGNAITDSELLKQAYALIVSYLDSEKNKSNGLVSSYIIDESAIIVTLANGLEYYIFFSSLLAQPTSSASTTQAVAPSVSFSATANSSNKIITLQPTYYEVGGKTDVYKNTAQKIVQNVDGYMLDKSLYGPQVTVDIMAKLKDYKVIFLDAHGDTLKNGGYNVQIAEEMTEEKNERYQEDFGAGILLSSEYLLTEMFFKQNYRAGDFNNSVFYLGTCHGADATSKISDVLRSKGVATVLAYTNKVNVEYVTKMCKAIFEAMSTKFGVIGRSLYTVNQAVDFAKFNHGATDGPSRLAYLFWDYMGSPLDDPSEIKIFGDGSFRLDSSYISGVVKTIDGKYPSNAWAEAQSPGYNTYTYARVRVMDSVEHGYDGYNGYFTIPYAEEICNVEISALGYLTRKVCNISVELGRTTSISETWLIPPSATGARDAKIGGKITDSIGTPVSGATVRFYNNHGVKSGDYVKDANGRVIVLTSASDGSYRVENLPRGYYTAEVTMDGFITKHEDVYAYIDTLSENIIISSVLSEGQYRIVLTWGANPRDLDSHITGPLSNGTTFHVYYDRKNAYDSGALVANLDVDNTTSYGPETVTLNPSATGTYRYYVYDYTGDPNYSIASSGAKVQVYQGNALLNTYYAPTNQGNGRYWTVFEIVNGTVRPINQVGSNVTGAVTSASAVAQDIVPAKETIA